MMTPKVKSDLVFKIREFEDTFNSGSAVSHERKMLEILDPLFSHDGFHVHRNVSKQDTGIDYMAYNSEILSTIGMQYKHFSKGKTSVDHVRTLLGTAHNMDRAILISPNGFTAACYELIHVASPIKIELLGIDEIKSWISKIEAEKDLSLLDYENIIKVVSEAFIDKIVGNPDFLESIEWRELEKMLAEIFEGLAFNVTLTPPSKDGGKDIILECTNKGSQQNYIVEIKHWRSLQKVGQKSVTQFLNVICKEKAKSGLFLSTYGFTDNAFEGLTEIERARVKFGDKQKIITLCKKYLKVRSGIWTPLNDLQELLLEQTI